MKWGVLYDNVSSCFHKSHNAVNLVYLCAAFMLDEVMLFVLFCFFWLRLQNGPEVRFCMYLACRWGHVWGLGDCWVVEVVTKSDTDGAVLFLKAIFFYQKCFALVRGNMAEKNISKKVHP